MSLSYDRNPFVLLRILIADHRVSINQSLTALLSEMEGVCVFGCAQESAKVLALVQTVHPDVVILDLQIDEPTSLELLKRIKCLPASPYVIVLSPYDMPPLREASMTARADLFLNKTSECDRLQAVLQKLLQEKIGTGHSFADRGEEDAALLTI
jgi:DNA-binding NarL/FixJ family response regulator